MSAASGKPAPRPTVETQPYWDGCRSGELRLQRCAACEHVQFPPRRFCASCLTADLRWESASGRGRIRTFSVVRHPISLAFAAEVPYVVALVELDEGPTIMAGIRGCQIEDVEIGLAVEVEFEQRSDEIYLPYFHPC